MAKKGKGLFFFGTLGIALSLIPIMKKVKSVLQVRLIEHANDYGNTTKKYLVK